MPNGKDTPNNMIIQIAGAQSNGEASSSNYNQATAPAPLLNRQIPPLMSSDFQNSNPNNNSFIPAQSTNVLQTLGNDVSATSALSPINLGNGLSLNLMQLPLLATTLMESLRNGFPGILPVQEPPKYDMKLQKEIHSIQVGKKG